MAEAPKDDDTKFNETLKRMLKTPPKPRKPPTGKQVAAPELNKTKRKPTK